MQHLAEPVDILDGQRPIEPQLRADLRNRLWILILPGNDAGRIARHELLEQENQHADQQQCRDDLRKADAEQAAHRLLLHLQTLQPDHAVRDGVETGQLRGHADGVLPVHR